MISALLYALVGLFVGSLINRAADNLPPPARRSLWSAPRCAYCGEPRAVVEQIGVAGLLFARNRCHTCASPLPLRAPGVELLTAIGFAYLWLRFENLPLALTLSFFTALLLLISVIDLEHRLILNVVVLPALVIALFAAPLTMQTQSANPNASVTSLFLRAGLGALSGLALVFLIYLFGAVFARVMSRARGRAIDEVPFGMGDVKLAGFVGALVGFPAIFFVLFYTILVGGVVSILVIVYQLLAHRRYSAFMAIPYGPFFCITGFVFMLRGGEVVRAWVG
jgi:leader peptidase (prepilin peptidase)/N-methyltransferase